MISELLELGERDGKPQQLIIDSSSSEGVRHFKEIAYVIKGAFYSSDNGLE